MLRKSKKLFRSIICLLLAVTMLFTSNVEYAFAGFGSGVAPVTITTSSRPRGHELIPSAVTTKLTGRYLVGAGWVFSIAKYNTSASAGYTALGVDELAKAYQNGVLVYNDIDFDGCASGHRTISQEISGHDLHVGSNALVYPGYYFEDLGFNLKGYSYSPTNAGIGSFNPRLVYAGFEVQTVTNSEEKMSCIPFSQQVDLNSNTKLQVSDRASYANTLNIPTYISGVYEVNTSNQNGVAYALGKLEPTHVEGYPKVKITCPCNNTSNCGSDICGHYIFSCSCSPSSTCANCQYNTHNSKVENSVTKFEYNLANGSKGWSTDNNLAYGASLSGSTVLSKVLLWSGCGCNSSSYCNSCRKLDFSDTCGCNTGEHSSIPSKVCSNCSYVWKDKAKVSINYKTFDGKVGAMYKTIFNWKGSPDWLLNDMPFDKIPEDKIGITNGLWTGESNLVDLPPAADDTNTEPGRWTQVAKALLGDASNVSLKYEKGDYVLEEDFPSLPGKSITVYYRNDKDKYDKIKGLVSSGDFEVSVTGNEITINGKSKKGEAYEKAQDDAESKLAELPEDSKYKQVLSVWNFNAIHQTDKGYSEEDGLGLRIQQSCYINYDFAGGKPVGVAETLGTSGSSVDMQYNAYGLGGHVSIRGGNESSFDNGLYSKARDYAISDSSASIIHDWYCKSVKAESTVVEGMREFGDLVSDTNSTFNSMIGNTDLKISGSTSASQVSNDIGKDIRNFNELWAVIEGKSNKDYDLNNAVYRGTLYDQLVALNGNTKFKDSSGHEITRDEFVDNEVYGEGEDWIYVIVAVPVVLIENYVSGTTQEDEAALGTDRGQTTLAVYPSCEFLRYDGSLNNDNSNSVGNILLGQETYSTGSYLGCFAGMSGVYSVGHKQYLSKENGGATWDVVIGTGVTGQISGTTYTTSGERIDYDGVKKVFKDENMDLKPDNYEVVEPDFKGFVVYGANLDMGVRLASNVTAYLDSTSFDATDDAVNVKNYTDVDFSNIGVRNYTLNEDEKDNKVALDTTPYDVSLTFSYTTKGLRYWYSSQELNPAKKLYRTALEKDIATSEVVGISTSDNKKTNEYIDYDILNETSQFYIKSGNSDSKFLIYKKDDVNGNYLHNIVQYAKDRTKIKYNGIGIGGEISFGKLYTTSVVYDTAESSATLAGALYKKIDTLENWSGKGFVNYSDLTAKKNRYVDRSRGNYTSLKTRGMVLGARLLVNGLELVDPVDNNNNNLDHPGRFVLSGSEENGYSAVGNGQYATVSVQVYEKRKTNKSHLKVIDIEVDEDGNFKSANDNGGFIHSRDEYYYDEESYLDWTNSESGITLITDRTDAEIAIKSENAQFINYMAVPNSSDYGYKTDGSSCFSASNITSNNYTIDKLQSELGALDGDCKLRSTNETGVNIGTTPKNEGYTVYVFRYYVKYQDGTTGEADGSITADSSLYLEDYELSHVYNNIYNRKDATAANIKDYYIRTSYSYKYTTTSSKIHHSWISGYNTEGYKQIGNSEEYRQIVGDFKRYIWQNRLAKSSCDSIVGKYDVNGKPTDASHNDSYYTVDGYNFSTIMGSNSNKDIVGNANAFDWSYPQNSALAIPFSTTLTRNANAKLGYSVMLTRDMAGDKVVISGLTDSTVNETNAKDKDGHSIETPYNDAMRKAFISYLEASGVIKNGKDVNDIPQNDDAITASKVGIDNTTANTSTNHRSTSATNTQSIRYGSDVTSDTDTASQDASATNQYYSVKDRISLTGGWQLSADKFKQAEVFGDKPSAFKGETTAITNELYGNVKGIGQYYVLRHDTESDFSDLRTLMIFKDRNGDRVHGFIANIDVYQYFYKYYVGARGIGENTEYVLGGIARPTGLTDYLFDAKDYLSTYTGTDSKVGKLPVYTGGTSDNIGAYTQAYLKTHDIIVGYYPEVKMSMQIPDLETVDVSYGVDGETRTQIKSVKCSSGEDVLGIYTDTIWTMGEYIRKTKLSSLYFVGIKSSGGADTTNKLYSDNSVSNANGSVFGNTIPSLYAGADVSLVVEPKFSIWTYGYSLDLINKDYDNFNNIVSLEGQRSGNSYNYTYKNVINDEVDIYEKWGNTTSSSSRDKLVSDFEDFTKAFGMSLEADVVLKSVNSMSYNNGIISSDTSADAETYQNFSTSVGKLVSDPVNDGEHELVYTIEIAHGQLVENPSTVGGNSFNAMLKQMAVDYYGIVDGTDGKLATQRVTDEQLQAMKDMFMDSGMIETILDSIESDTDEDNTSNPVGHKILGISNKASWNNINADHWYDERVKTFVVRRFYQKSALDSVVLDDKLDYNMGVSSTGTNDNVQNSYNKKTYCWFLNLYMDSKLIDRTKLANQAIADYFTQGTVYGDNTASNTNWYLPTRNDNVNAYKAGTGLVRNLYLPGGDFNIVSDAVAN